MTSRSKLFPAAFTLVELLVTILLLCVLTTCLIPALAKSHPQTKTLRCANNLRQLQMGWRQWSEDNNGTVLSCESMLTGRPQWISGILNADGSNASNYDTNTDVAKSPLWTYIGKNPDLIKCPSDSSMVALSSAWNGLPARTLVPRVRSVSMSGVFGSGGWWSGGTAPNSTWRCYAKSSDIVLPAHTFIFTEENCNSLNDCEFNIVCTGNQPNDAPNSSMLPSCPASYHNGAGNLSFADGHIETHPWAGSFIRLGNITGTLLTNAGDSWVDAHWLAQNTTVKW